MNRDYNPFANLDLHFPKAYWEDVKRYTTTQGGDGDTSVESSPFKRYVDLWAAAIAVGAQVGAFVSIDDKDARHRFIQGSVLQGDLTRIEFLQLLAIGHSGDPYVVKDSRKVIEIAEAYAAGGLPILMEWLEGGVQTPMVSLTKNLIKFLNEAAPDVEAPA
ncbi:MAG TPA: hypothetical protein PKD80_05160 [Microthrixaceae bacterium]|nr:hypothetical protein [Microthrixaceae bacterium]HMT24436.1 hypothetical protein [Microthrixaceae bacterium]HMT60867.1 hypothetical protein [Microthrixaceae bacterium]